VAAEADREIAGFEQRRPGRIKRRAALAGAQSPGGGSTGADRRNGGGPSALVADRDLQLAGLISRTSSGTPQAKAGSFLMRKWYMLLHRLVVFLAEGHLALGRLEAHAFHGGDELVGAVSPLVFFSASTTAMAALMPPAVKKSGGALNWL
jgi:hypothetical protein